MKNIKSILAIGMLLFGMSATAKDYKYETVPGDLMQTRIYTLDNGLKVYLSVNKEKPRIQTYIAVRTGSKNDPAETTGLAHYLEHLMFKGTMQFGTNNPVAEGPLLNDIEKRYEEYRTIKDPELRRQKYHEIDSVSQLAAQYFIPNEYDKLMAAIGSEGSNAYTSNDVTCYVEDIPANEVENWAKIQSDRFQNMVIRGFHTELEAVYEEYNIGLSSDQRKLFYTISKMLWPNHPYGLQTTIGTQDHLKNPSIVNIKNYLMAWRAKQANALQSDTLQLLEDVLSNGRAGLFDLNLNQTMKVQRANGGCELMHDHGGFFLMGTPKQGQSLEEVRSLMLAEIDKLKKGDFPENLLPSIINNKKRSYYQLLESNSGRADQFVDAFINEIDWKQQVGTIDRISKITKPELVAFANRFFTNNYVTVFKKQGIDTNQKKIDKPAITPIQANRDQMSQFVKDIQDSQVEPIQPKFVDYKTDFSSSDIKKGMPLYYVKNNTNGLFNLDYRYEFGQSADKRYDMAADYIRYLGTNRLSATDIKQKFYELACDWNISVGEESITVSLSGLSENMSKAMTLLDDLFQHAKADQEAYDQLVDLTMKKRDDAKKSQQSYFAYLYAYGTQGTHNAYRDLVSEQELKNTKPQVFIDLLKKLRQYEHSVLYYGPIDEKTVAATVMKQHSTAKQLSVVPENNPYLQQMATTNEVLLAPYDAKNIYMRMYHNEGRDWNPDEAAVRSLFNEYFGGGMNGIVFQEMRETRGLAYNAYAMYYRPSVKGRKESFMTHIITQNDKMMDCIGHFKEILDEMPASENGFNIAKDALTKQLASMRTTKMSIIYSFLSAKRLGIDYDLNGKIYQDLPKVTLQDVVNYEKQLMANKQYRYIILGDEKNLDIPSLEKIAPVKRLTTEEVFGY